MGNVGTDGDLFIELDPVELVATTGEHSSVTEVTATEAGTYEQLINIDAYVEVHLPNGGAVVAAGEVGAGATTCKIVADCP
jgi:gamma-glutamyl phosphate reductase